MDIRGKCKEEYMGRRHHKKDLGGQRTEEEEKEGRVCLACGRTVYSHDQIGLLVLTEAWILFPCWRLPPLLLLPVASQSRAGEERM